MEALQTSTGLADRPSEVALEDKCCLLCHNLTLERLRLEFVLRCLALWFVFVIVELSHVTTHVVFLFPFVLVVDVFFLLLVLRPFHVFLLLLSLLFFIFLAFFIFPRVVVAVLLVSHLVIVIASTLLLVDLLVVVLVLLLVATRHTRDEEPRVLLESFDEGWELIQRNQLVAVQVCLLEVLRADLFDLVGSDDALLAFILDEFLQGYVAITIPIDV
mmetsp:Transcript_63236/g.137933  ORF Transcript_63236/g.137933 Transcript_63236/m.137933 type:complete len:216 (-) Transcript_63236:712-1359(-)